ncbi:MAG: hypothetical protein HQL33_02635 [Alphaproteobacteria bacterium]|nr:hypothetical protein [Alphaproteobacteria bacterium]
MKRVIVIVVLLLILLLGTGVFLVLSNLVPQTLLPYLTFLPPSMTAPAEEKPPPPVRKTLVQMDPLTVPLIREGKLRGQVAFELQLEVKHSDHERIRQEMARIRDVYLNELADFLPDHMAGRRTPDLILVKARLMRVSDKEFGKGTILRILLDNIFVR